MWMTGTPSILQASLKRLTSSMISRPLGLGRDSRPRVQMAAVHVQLHDGRAAGIEVVVKALGQETILPLRLIFISV